MARVVAPHLGLEVGDVLLCMGGLKAQVPPVHPRGCLGRNPGLHQELLQDPAQAGVSYATQQASGWKATVFGITATGRFTCVKDGDHTKSCDTKVFGMAFFARGAIGYQEMLSECLAQKEQAGLAENRACNMFMPALKPKTAK
jgi:hypothetical protein